MNPSKGMEAAEAEIYRLRSSNADLKAENEALKEKLSEACQRDLRNIDECAESFKLMRTPPNPRES